MSALLKVKGLMAGYGKVPVLHGINLEVGEGEILGVLGHNGMGKTTLLKTLMGIVPATGGQVIFDGEDLSEMKSSGRASMGLGYVPQGRGIFPNLSVQDNLRMGVAAHDMDEVDAIERVRVWGITAEADLGDRVPTVSFSVEGLSPRWIAEMLAAENIFVWDGDSYAVEVIDRLGLREAGGLVRVGAVHYNTPAEIEQLVRAVDRIVHRN